MNDSPRSRPWIWGLAVIAILFTAGWVSDPVHAGAVTAPLGDQIFGITAWTLPVATLVGGPIAFIPPRHIVGRGLLLIPTAFYVAGTAAVFTFSVPGQTCGSGPCDAATASRLVGLAVQAGVWGAGRAAEAAALWLRALVPST